MTPVYIVSFFLLILKNVVAISIHLCLQYVMFSLGHAHVKNTLVVPNVQNVQLVMLDILSALHLQMVTIII